MPTHVAREKYHVIGVGYQKKNRPTEELTEEGICGFPRYQGFLR